MYSKVDDLFENMDMCLLLYLLMEKSTYYEDKTHNVREGSLFSSFSQETHMHTYEH